MEYPANCPDIPTPNLVVHLPIHDVNTAAYKDMEVFLERVYRQFILSGGHRVVVVYGDEQFVMRCWYLLGKRFRYYGNILPFPGDQDYLCMYSFFNIYFIGELHLSMHIAYALMRLGGDAYIIPAATTIGYKFLEV